MRERIIRIGVLAVVFVLAVLGFSHFTNQGNTDMTAAMDSATLPLIFFERNGQEMNCLVGHKEEMNISVMRDMIFPYQGTAIQGKIQMDDAAIKEMKYEIWKLDGSQILKEGEASVEEGSFRLESGNLLEDDEEALLKITLSAQGSPIYYYTRVVKETDFRVSDCLSYVKKLHQNLLQKQDTQEIKRVLEPNETGNNTTLQHVTIHSNLEHVMWGELRPEVIGSVQIEVKEAKEAYTSVLLDYRVKCAGDNNAEEFYRVKEFFKVSCQNGSFYLLEYDRTMSEEFKASNVVLVSKGINLGITPEAIPYKVNKTGTIVAFVQQNELWSYQKEEDAFALVFSFSDSERDDIRNFNDEHAIRILSMEDNGNMTFSVYGYMNRGVHEGKSGLTIYYYKMEQNVIEEKAFIPSTDSFLLIERELNKLAYYSAKQDTLYVLLNGALQKVDMKENKTEVLVENLQTGQYVTSEDGHLFAHLTTTEAGDVVEVWNFETGEIQKVTSEAGERIIPQGFVADDFVYGLAKEENRGKDALGEEVLAMHAIQIRNGKNEVVKDYQATDTYILSASVQGNMITLRRGEKTGQVYREVSEDYITNNTQALNEFVELKTYWTDLKETQLRLVFTEGIQDKKAKVLKPKQLLQENITTLATAKQEQKEYYAVYGLGKQAGLFKEAGQAIRLADELSGVVVSPRQNYAWEDGNRVAWYRNFNIAAFVRQPGENTLQSCVKAVLSYEEAGAQAVSELKESSAVEVLQKYITGEVIRFRDCSAKDMFYLIDKGTPVIALKNSEEAVMMIGYDALTVTYIEPSSGGIRSTTIEKFNEMVAGSGHTFIGYVK